MPKITKPLTDGEIRKAKASDRDRKLYDGRGLIVLIRPSGTKSFQYRYKINGKSKVYTLGQYGIRKDELSLADARTLLATLRVDVKKGIDPASRKQTQQKSRKNTFRAVAEEWFSKQSVSWKDSHRKKVAQWFAANVYPYISDHSIDAITISDMRSVITHMESRGVYDLAKRANQYCGNIFQYAIANGWCQNNPASALTPHIKTKKRQNRKHMRAGDLHEFMKTMNNDKSSPLLRIATHLTVLTFLRPIEVRGAKWNEINLGAAQWVVPAERMKHGLEHIVPLSTQACALLSELQKITGNHEYLLPSPIKKHQPISDVAILRKVKAYSGNKSTTHGFRHTASTILHEKGFDDRHVEKQMAHLDRNHVRAAYNKAEYEEARIKMMQWWADFLHNT